MYYADEKQLIDMWRFEEQFPFGGWELMHLDGRWESEPLPWDYREEVLMRLKDTDMLLDMDTGDGGFLLSLRHPYELTCATESDERDYESCVEQLAPLGIRTMFCNVDEEELPFEDDMFDMVLSRHGGYMIEELFRVLKPGGLFIPNRLASGTTAPFRAGFCPNMNPRSRGIALKTRRKPSAGTGSIFSTGRSIFQSFGSMTLARLRTLRT